MRPFFGRSKMSRVLSARARARARARPSCSTGASGPFDDRRLRSTTFRARATLVLLLYRTFFGALIVLLRLEANLSGSTLTCRFTFICRFWVLLKVCRLIPSRTTGVELAQKNASTTPEFVAKFRLNFHEWTTLSARGAQTSHFLCR